jgi:ABC-type transport system involved in multi-copper enzyme maturation permease subunit
VPSPKPSRSSLVGPLAGWELVRLARRGQSHHARLLLLYILTLTFVLFAYFWFTTGRWSVAPRELFFGRPDNIPHTVSARFADEFALAVLLAQLAVVAVITPPYAAAAVAEEKDRKTLPLLLTTALTDREVVFGKAAGRAGFVLAVVFAGTPVLMIARLFGGIDFAFLVYGYLVIAGTTVLTTAIGIFTACRAPDFRSAVVPAYVLTFLFVCGGLCFMSLSPFGILVLLHVSTGLLPLLMAPGYAAGQCLLGVYLLSLAARALRYEEQPPPLTSDFPLPPKLAGPPPRPTEPRDNLPRLDPDRPILWREWCTAAPWAGWRQVLVFVVGGVAGLIMAGGGAALIDREVKKQYPAEAARIARSYPDPPDEGGQAMMVGSVLVLGVYLVPLALGVAGMIARERERQTLDSLLSVPLGRREILLAKLRAYAERAWVMGAVAVAGVGVAFGAEGGPWLGLAAAAAAITGVGLVVGLGTWLSVRCAGSLRAFRLLLPAVVVVVGLPVAVWNGIDWARSGRWAWGYGSAAAGFGLAGLVLWWRAVGELERGG